MDSNISKNSPTVLAVVRSSQKFNVKYANRKSFRYKGKFNRNLLPSVVDYYSQNLNKFYQRKVQATALCPFHNERNPSFSVNLKTGAFMCFACGASGGGIIDFHMKRYNLSFVNTCKELGVWHE